MDIENNIIEFTNDEKHIIKYMFSNLFRISELTLELENCYGITSNDVYDLMVKLRLEDVYYG